MRKASPPPKKNDSAAVAVLFELFRKRKTFRRDMHRREHDIRLVHMHRAYRRAEHVATLGRMYSDRAEPSALAQLFDALIRVVDYQ